MLLTSTLNHVFWVETLHERSTDICSHSNLSEHTCQYICQWSQHSLKWSCKCRGNSIHPQNSQFEDRSPQPHQNKHHDPVDHGPDDRHGDADEDHKDVVKGQLGVFVDEPNHFVKLDEGFGALVLCKAVLKIQL